MSIYLYSLLLGAIVILALIIRRTLSFKQFPTAPGPKAAPWTHAWYLWKVWEGSFERWNVTEHAVHGKVIRITPKMYSIDDPDSVKTIYGLKNAMPKARWYRSFGPMPDWSLFSATTPQFHGEMRRRVAHLYSMTSIKHYEPYVDNCIMLMLEIFDRFSETGESLDLQLWMQCYAFDVVGEITYGKRGGFLESGGQDLDGAMKSTEAVIRFSTMHGIEPRLLPLWLAWTGGNPFKGLNKLLNKLERTRKARADGGQTFCDKADTLRKAAPEDYEKYHVDVNIGGNVGAGSDTTSITLTAILYHLSKRREVLLRLRNEIWSAASKGEVDEPITFDQAQKITYLQYVMKEALRIHPATGLPMWREIQPPGLKVADMFFPAGAIVGINTWVAHMNRSVFGDDAHEFRPDRWDPAVTPKSQLEKMEQYYMPFGAGTRTCIGKNISILEISKLIPELVRRYDFTLVNDELKCSNYWFVKQKDLRITVARWSH